MREIVAVVVKWIFNTDCPPGSPGSGTTITSSTSMSHIPVYDPFS